MNNLIGEILEICTYHSDDGTSGYLITPEQAEKILSLVASKMPEWKDEAYYTKHPVTWKPVAPEGNAEHYAAGFNQAIDSVKSILKGGTGEQS